MSGPTVLEPITRNPRAVVRDVTAMDTSGLFGLVALDCPRWCTQAPGHAAFIGTEWRVIHLGRTSDGREIEQFETAQADGSLTRGPVRVIEIDGPDPAA
ncbi:hypothetical protein ACQPX6_21430 [Actinomycetospora sp. CA-101289]|uniref:hypothetical protein n=1 Tax=Actinomycetospora sp. CA-101289 TaxID=3239893 RepID=UPI003D98D2B7